MLYRGVGSGAYIMTFGLALLIMVASAFLLPEGFLSGNVGICLPSADQWPLTWWGGRLINGALLIAYTLWISIFNKSYNIVSRDAFTFSSLFLILSACNPYVCGELSNSALLAGCNLLGLSIFFGCYRERQATQETFAVATFVGIGAMVDYAFLLMTPFWLIAMGMLKILRFREILAFLLGLAAPFWVSVGFGWIAPSDFNLPQFASFFSGYTPPLHLMTMLVTLALFFICATLASLNTAVRLYAGNPKPRTFNYIIYLMAIYCALLMIIDSSNLSSYMGTVYIGIALALTNIFTLYNVPKTKLWLTVIYLLAIAGWSAVIFL